MTPLRTILFCLLCTPVWGQNITIICPIDPVATNMDLQYSKNGVAWSDVTNGLFGYVTLPATNLQAEVQSIVGGRPVTVADINCRNFFRVRYDYGTNDFNQVYQSVMHYHPVVTNGALVYFYTNVTTDVSQPVIRIQITP